MYTFSKVLSNIDYKEWDVLLWTKEKPFYNG